MQAKMGGLKKNRKIKYPGTEVPGYFIFCSTFLNSFPQNTYENTGWFQCLYKNYLN